MAKFLSPDSRSDWKLGHAETQPVLHESGLRKPHPDPSRLHSRGVAEADVLVSRQLVHEVHDLQSTAESAREPKRISTAPEPCGPRPRALRAPPPHQCQSYFKIRRQYLHNRTFQRCSLLAETQKPATVTRHDISTRLWIINLRKTYQNHQWIEIRGGEVHSSSWTELKIQRVKMIGRRSRSC